MGDKSKIEWTDATWTPIRARHRAIGKIGWHCEHATTGCINCYSEGMNKRLGTGLSFKPGHRADIEIFLDEKMLSAPMRWKRPRMVFVCSMTDLFADFVTDEMIDQVFAVMSLCPQHTFQVLTKRAKRMREYFGAARERIAGQMWTISERRTDHMRGGWPLRNVWLGVSTEDQATADERIPHLLGTPAAVRFISAEPLLGAINIEWALSKNRLDIGGGFLQRGHFAPGLETIRRLDWVIAGGESGRDARPMHPDWARSLRDQCAAAGVPFFFKQWGEWSAVGQVSPDTRKLTGNEHLHRWESGPASVRVGKKAAGRLFDGLEYNGMPTS